MGDPSSHLTTANSTVKPLHPISRNEPLQSLHAHHRSRSSGHRVSFPDLGQIQDGTKNAIPEVKLNSSGREHSPMNANSANATTTRRDPQDQSLGYIHVDGWSPSASSERLSADGTGQVLIGKVTREITRDPSISSSSSIPIVKRKDRPTRQDSGPVRYASRIRISDFHRDKDLRFRWPKPLHREKIDPARDNVLRLDDNDHYPLKFLDNIGQSDGSLVDACEISEQDHGFGATVAVKKINCELDDIDQNKELVIQGKLRHNHIASMLGYYTQGKRIGIVMYPVAQYHLAKYMRSVVGSGQYDTRNSLDGSQPNVIKLHSFFRCLCEALHYLHSQEEPVKHKDIKPENILIDRYGCVILTDFGLSRSYRSVAEARSEGPTGMTRKYAPPEAVDQRERTLNSDIFSLGCVFLEMATVILGYSLEQLDHRIGHDENGHFVISYHDSQHRVVEWVNKLKKRQRKLQLSRRGSEPVGSFSVTNGIETHILDVILAMMSNVPHRRPELEAVLETFRSMCGECSDCDASNHNSLTVLHGAEKELHDSQPVPARQATIASTLSHEPDEQIDAEPTSSLKTINGSWRVGAIPEDVSNLAEQSVPLSQTLPLQNDGVYNGDVSNAENAIALTPPPDHQQRNIASEAQGLARLGGGNDTFLKAAGSPRTSAEGVPVIESSSQEQPPKLNDNSVIIRQETIRIYQPKQRSVKSVAVDDARRKIAGRKIVLYTESPDALQVVPKKNFPWQRKGIFMRLPVGLENKLRTPIGDLDLSKLLTKSENALRMVGLTRMIFIEGNFEENYLLTGTDSKSSRG